MCTKRWLLDAVILRTASVHQAITSLCRKIAKSFKIYHKDYTSSPDLKPQNLSKTTNFNQYNCIAELCFISERWHANRGNSRGQFPVSILNLLWHKKKTTKKEENKNKKDQERDEQGGSRQKKEKKKRIEGFGGK